MLSIFHLRSMSIFLLFSLPISGCRTHSSDGFAASNAPIELSDPAASAVAGDMVSKFAEQIGPGKHALALEQDNSPFGQALEAALKGWGYAVVTDQKADSKVEHVSLTYTLEPYEQQVLVRLSTKALDIGRAYSVTAQGAAAVSPLSVMKRDRGGS